MDVVLGLLTLAAQEPPEPEDVKAGWVAFGIFLLLVAALVVLGFSLVKQLRKAERAEEAGLYGKDERGSDSDAAGAPEPGAADGSPGPADGSSGTDGRAPTS